MQQQSCGTEHQHGDCPVHTGTACSNHVASHTRLVIPALQLVLLVLFIKILCADK